MGLMPVNSFLESQSDYEHSDHHRPRSLATRWRWILFPPAIEGAARESSTALGPFYACRTPSMGGAIGSHGLPAGRVWYAGVLSRRSPCTFRVTSVTSRCYPWSYVASAGRSNLSWWASAWSPSDLLPVACAPRAGP